jgi:hypothetical protein
MKPLKFVKRISRSVLHHPKRPNASPLQTDYGRKKTPGCAGAFCLGRKIAPMNRRGLIHSVVRQIPHLSHSYHLYGALLFFRICLNQRTKRDWVGFTRVAMAVSCMSMTNR